jgi:plasmid stabilization system protein ParE
MFRVSAEADGDIRDAAQWYEQQQAGLGAEFVHEIDAVFSRIDDGALRFPVVYRALRRALVRRFSYAIYFERDDIGDVLVLAVLHQRLDRTLLDERFNR